MQFRQPVSSRGDKSRGHINVRCKKRHGE